MSASRKFLGRGFAFPLRVNPNGGIATASEERLVQQSIWLILATGKGELQRNPNFGCGIHKLVFSDNTPANRAQIAHQVREAGEDEGADDDGQAPCLDPCRRGYLDDRCQRRSRDHAPLCRPVGHGDRGRECCIDICRRRTFRSHAPTMRPKA